MKHLWCHRWLCLLSASALALPLTAQGQDPASEAEALESTQAAGERPLAEELSGSALSDYQSAHIAYRDGDVRGALLKFTAAYESSRNPRLLWNIAACEKALRNYARVMEIVTQYKYEMGIALTEKREQQADALLEVISAYVAELEVEVSEADAVISIDGVPRGESPLHQALLVTHGRRELEVSKPGFQTFARGLMLQGRKTMHVSVDLELALHQGTLVVDASEGDAIRVDGEAVALGHWRGTLPSGEHTVSVTAANKQPYESTVLIRDDETDTLRVRLSNVSVGHDDSRRRRRVLIGVASALVAAAGAGVGGYYLLRDEGPSFAPADRAFPYGE